MPCFKGSNPKSVSERVEDIAVRMGIMKDADRVGHYPIGAQNESGHLLNGEPFGNSIEVILKNRKKTDDYILIGHLCGLLMEKESTDGFDSFSEAEKTVYLVGDMVRQLDSGGFGTYFYNTGYLASMLPRALNEIGANKCMKLVDEAISKFGKVPSNDYEKMLKELSKITEDFKNDLWEELDKKYYELDEGLGKKIMDYVNVNQEYFSP